MEVIPFTDPQTRQRLEQVGSELCRPDGQAAAFIKDGIPRFVPLEDTYAESFGYQWKRWDDARSDVRNPGHNLKETLWKRTHFQEYDMEGKTLLECGMGGGDDTEVLLQLPFAQVHSFDLSTAVERAARYQKDSRLTISQASIFDIPYADQSFDVVYCHRVLQHTPDPERALRAICRKVKPGGILFAHAYKKSFLYMAEWRYKYRWFTKRLSWQRIQNYVDNWGPRMHRLTHWMYGSGLGRAIAYNFVPWYYVSPKSNAGLSKEQLVEMEQHVTFDAMTPWHDHPMSSKTFLGIIESEGFDIEHLYDPTVSPIYCTGRRRTS